MGKNGIIQIFLYIDSFFQVYEWKTNSE